MDTLDRFNRQHVSHITDLHDHAFQHDGMQRNFQHQTHTAIRQRHKSHDTFPPCQLMAGRLEVVAKRAFFTVVGDFDTDAVFFAVDRQEELGRRLFCAQTIRDRQLQQAAHFFQYQLV